MQRRRRHPIRSASIADALLRIVALIAVLLSVSEVALAQPAPKPREPSSADVRVANDLYKTGHNHVKDAQWEEAFVAFSRAYELYPQPVILANLAGAEVQTSRVVAAVEHYRQLLKQPTGMSQEEIELVKSAMQRAEAKLAHVHVTVTSGKPTDRVEIDGAVLTSAALGIDYPVNPGSHVITAARSGSETARAEITLREGESKKISLAPRALPSGDRAPVEPEKRGLLGSPWFWIAAGVVLAGAAVAICLGAVCKDDEPYSGNLGRIDLR